MQNSAARLITRSRKCEHITPIMKQLHWLPVSHRIIYKLVLITYRARNGIAPSYIKDFVQPYVPTRNLRSSSRNLLEVPSVKLVSYGQRSFSFVAPMLWNPFPDYIRGSDSLSKFKTDIKTYLFKQINVD